MLRHMILNSIRMYNAKYREKYGQMVIAMDCGSWRKKVFEHYKAKRKTTREASNIDWDGVYAALNNIRDEIRENLPFKVVEVRGAEADDIIGVLVERTQVIW